MPAPKTKQQQQQQQLRQKAQKQFDKLSLNKQGVETKDEANKKLFENALRNGLSGLFQDQTPQQRKPLIDYIIKNRPYEYPEFKRRVVELLIRVKKGDKITPEILQQILPRQQQKQAPADTQADAQAQAQARTAQAQARTAQAQARTAQAQAQKAQAQAKATAKKLAEQAKAVVESKQTKQVQKIMDDVGTIENNQQSLTLLKQKLQNQMTNPTPQNELLQKYNPNLIKDENAEIISNILRNLSTSGKRKYINSVLNTIEINLSRKERKTTAKKLAEQAAAFVESKKVQKERQQANKATAKKLAEQAAAAVSKKVQKEQQQAAFKKLCDQLKNQRL